MSALWQSHVLQLSNLQIYLTRKKKKSTHKQKASKQQKQKENPLAGPELKAVEESEEKRGREERGSSAPLQHGALTWHPAGNHNRTYTAFSLSRSALN